MSSPSGRIQVGHKKCPGKDGFKQYHDRLTVSTTSPYRSQTDTAHLPSSSFHTFIDPLVSVRISSISETILCSAQKSSISCVSGKPPISEPARLFLPKMMLNMATGVGLGGTSPHTPSFRWCLPADRGKNYNHAQPKPYLI